MSLAKTAQQIELPLGQDLVFVPQSAITVIDDDTLESFLGNLKDDKKVESKEEPKEVIVEVDEDEDDDVFLVLPFVPGGESQDEIVVEDQHDLAVEEEEDIVVSEPDTWDWQARGISNFAAWLDKMMKNVPRHTGFDSVGLERAISYLDALDRIISKAVRMDLKNELDINKIERGREEIRKGMERLEERLDKIHTNKYKRKSKKKADEEQTGIVKEAQKIAGVKGVVVTVPLLISHIARVCINATVSAGKDMEDTFKKLADKYKLDMREKAEAIQLISDMGYAIRHREGNFDEDFDSTSTDNIEYIQQFHA